MQVHIHLAKVKLVKLKICGTKATYQKRSGERSKVIFNLSRFNELFHFFTQSPLNFSLHFTKKYKGFPLLKIFNVAQLNGTQKRKWTLILVQGLRPYIAKSYKRINTSPAFLMLLPRLLNLCICHYFPTRKVIQF